MVHIVGFGRDRFQTTGIAPHFWTGYSTVKFMIVLLLGNKRVDASAGSKPTSWANSDNILGDIGE